MPSRPPPSLLPGRAGRQASSIRQAGPGSRPGKAYSRLGFVAMTGPGNPLVLVGGQGRHGVSPGSHVWGAFPFACFFETMGA